MFNLQLDDMKSALDPHASDLLLRARQGYTQRMLCLYLQHEKRLQITQPTLSRWLAFHDITLDLNPDDAFRHYQEEAAHGLTQRRYRRTLAQWRGHIEHLRNRGCSLSEIQADLKTRGITSSIRSIRRELGAL